MTAWSRAGLVALASLSLAVQGLGLSLNMGLEHFQHPEFYRADNPLIPDEAAWSWRGNQIGLRVVNIARKLRGEPLELHESQPYRPIVLVWNLFPIRAAIEIENRRLLAGLWTLWGLLVAGGLAATGWTAARARRLEAPAAGRT